MPPFAPRYRLAEILVVLGINTMRTGWVYGVHLNL
jgi:hypothetical protein